jgi:malonyl CoA-acyl carrier protein transacylase
MSGDRLLDNAAVITAYANQLVADMVEDLVYAYGVRKRMQNVVLTGTPDELERLATGCLKAIASRSKAVRERPKLDKKL